MLETPAGKKEVLTYRIQQPSSLMELGKSADSFSDNISHRLEDNMSMINTKRISNLIETYMELQFALDEKDNELKRFIEGYDTAIFKRFITRFSRVDEVLNEYIDDEGEGKDLKRWILKSIDS